MTGMFTGIIQSLGTVESLLETASDWRLKLSTGQLDLADVRTGDSIAVNGCCLTVVELSVRGFSADVSAETLRCTTLGNLKPGNRVNLEKAMLACGRLGGHIVSGHVDGVGVLLASTAEGGSHCLEFEVPPALARYVATKGSICIDGVSLTVNLVQENRFGVNIIPHTWDQTIVGDYRIGQTVNLEVDVVARYLERLQQADQGRDRDSGLDREFTGQQGSDRLPQE